MTVQDSDGKQCKKQIKSPAGPGDPIPGREKSALDKKARHFVEKALEFNPDATEQLDIGARLLSHVNTLGTPLQEKAAALCKAQAALCEQMGSMYDTPGPTDLQTLFSDLERIHENLNKNLGSLKTDGPGRWLEYIPGIPTPLRRYFSRFDGERFDLVTMVGHVDGMRDRLTKQTKDLEEQISALESLTQSFCKLAYLGHRIDALLCNARDENVPDGDPRRDFIDDELLPQVRNKIEVLLLHIKINKKCGQVLDLLNRSGLELTEAFNRIREATAEMFQTAALSAYILTHRKIIRDDMLKPADPLGQREVGLVTNPSLEPFKQSLHAFHGCGHGLARSLDDSRDPVKKALLNLKRLKKMTDKTLEKTLETVPFDPIGPFSDAF